MFTGSIGNFCEVISGKMSFQIVQLFKISSRSPRLVSKSLQQLSLSSLLG